MDTIHTIGRRKSSVARIYISPGKGNIVVNGRDFKEYFSLETLQYKLCQPLQILELEKFNSQLNTEITQFKSDGASVSDVDKLEELKDEADLFNKQKSKLREDKLYAEAARNMLQLSLIHI